MGITYNQQYIEIPQSGDGYLPAKGRAMDIYHAQTIARNLNYIAANKTAPVLGSTYGAEFNAPSSSQLLLLRGRAVLWDPYNEVKFVMKCKKDTSTGTVTCYLSDAAMKSTETTNFLEGSETVDDADYTTYTITLSNFKPKKNRMAYWYIMGQYLYIYSAIVYASVYNG